MAKANVVTGAEMIAAIAEKTGVTKTDAEKVIKAFTGIVGDTLAAGDKVQLIGFGTFETSIRAAREGRNPQTGEPMHIDESISVKFKPGKALKDRL